MKSHQNGDLEEAIKVVEIKLGQLKRDYEQYFLGTRPREPAILAGEVRKLIAMISNQAIRNTGLKFRFSSICSRYQAFNRQWQDTLRKIEQGTYTRHRFRADLHSQSENTWAAAPRPGPAEPAAAGDPTLYSAYVEARRECGQSVDNLSPAKLEAVLRKRQAGLSGGSDVRFRVVVEDGKARLKASRGG